MRVQDGLERSCNTKEEDFNQMISFSNRNEGQVKVSVVTPSLNRANWIEKTILSVTNQSYKNIEYIVMDGGSTDGTIGILKKYADAGLLSYVSESDNGMYDAINKGLMMSSGDVLAYLNSDDWYFPWTVSCVVNYLKTNQRVDLVYGDTVVYDFVGGGRRVNLYANASSAYLRSGLKIAQPTVFFTRRVFEEVGAFGIDTKVISDCEYWLRCVREGFRIGKIHEIFATECNHEATLRNRLSREIAHEEEIIRKKYGSCLNRNNMLNSIYRRMKYCEKELIYLLFKKRTIEKELRRGQWENFLQSCRCDFNVGQYYLKKIVRGGKLKSCWKLRCRDGILS